MNFLGRKTSVETVVPDPVRGDEGLRMAQVWYTGLTRE